MKKSLLFLEKWVPEYHFPVKTAAGLLFAFNAAFWFAGRGQTNAWLIAVALIAWCATDVFTDVLKFSERVIPDAKTVKNIQSLGGVWAFVIAATAVAAMTIAKGRFNMLTGIFAATLIGLMIYQVAHEATDGPDKKAAYASYAQQLIPAIMWLSL